MSSDEKKKNDNSEVLVDQAWRAGDRSKRSHEMTYAGATSFLGANTQRIKWS